MCMAATYVAAIAPAGARAVTHPDLQAAHDTGSIGAYRQDGVTPPLLSPKGSPSAIRQLTPVTWCPLVAPSPMKCKIARPPPAFGEDSQEAGAAQCVWAVWACPSATHENSGRPLPYIWGHPLRYWEYRIRTSPHGRRRPGGELGSSTSASNGNIRPHASGRYIWDCPPPPPT